jgi:HD-GYP domain-containing protein (c-di-GMP phosphodiesterase class II)
VPPRAARVWAAAAALAALPPPRPSRRKLPGAPPHDEILAQSGKQFDPAVVDAFREREPVLREAQRELAAA